MKNKSPLYVFIIFSDRDVPFFEKIGDELKRKNIDSKFISFNQRSNKYFINGNNFIDFYKVPNLPIEEYNMTFQDTELEKYIYHEMVSYKIKNKDALKKKYSQYFFKSCKILQQLAYDYKKVFCMI